MAPTPSPVFSMRLRVPRTSCDLLRGICQRRHRSWPCADRSGYRALDGCGEGRPIRAVSTKAFTGGAGTGKTTSLLRELDAHLAAHPLALGQRVLALTFMHGSRHRLCLSASRNPRHGGTMSALPWTGSLGTSAGGGGRGSARWWRLCAARLGCHQLRCNMRGRGRLLEASDVVNGSLRAIR